MGKRILVLHNGYPMLEDGGDKIRTLNMLHSLKQLDAKVYFLAFYKRGFRRIGKERSKVPAGITSFFAYSLPDRLGLAGVALYIRAIITWFIVKCYKIDIIHAETSLSVTSTRLVLGRVKLVTDFHADPVPEYEMNGYSGKKIADAKKDVHYALEHSEKVIAVSNNLLGNLSQYKLYKGEKSILPCCFNGKLFNVDEQERIKLRLKHNLTDRYVVCYLGGIQKWQCVEETIELFLQLKKLDSKYFFCFFSNDNVDWLVGKYNLDARDFLHKSLPYKEVPSYLTMIDAGFVLRRNSLVNVNASPTKTAEYLASGAMVICSAYSGDAPEMISQSGAGFVIEDVDNISSQTVQQLHEKIVSFVSSRPDSSSNARAYAFNNRLWEQNHIKLEQLYDSLLK